MCCPHHPQEKKKKWEPPAPPPRVGKKQRKRDAASGLGAKLPTVTPSAKCKLRLLKLERIKDYLLMEHEFVQNQEQLKPQDERNEEDRTKVGGGVGMGHGGTRHAARRLRDGVLQGGDCAREDQGMLLACFARHSLVPCKHGSWVQDVAAVGCKATASYGSKAPSLRQATHVC